MKLYAYLYYDCKGKFPTHLSLVDLAHQKFTVECSESKCKDIFEEAKALLIETNESIDLGKYQANANESNCKFCLYRPACSFYMSLLTTNNSFNDICGSITDVVQYQNGNVSVFFKEGTNKITVTGFDKDKFKFLKDNMNKQISLFNLRKEAKLLVYSVTKTTKIYEY